MVEKRLAPCDLGQIAASGQCFRIVQQRDGWWRICAGKDCVRVRQKGDMLCLDTDEAGFMGRWRDYFDWGTDYAAICAAVPESDVFLRQAIAYGSGLRILRQDLWETLITFVISQNNNILRIQRTVEAMCRTWGTPRQDSAGEIYYTFPDKAQLAQASLAQLRAIGLGYRDKYIDAIAHSDFDARQLCAMPAAQAEGALLALPGVGKKVAACVRLFGLHDLSAFPIDTWMQKICNAHYGGHFPVERYEGFAGVLQQYLFFYGRTSNR